MPLHIVGFPCALTRASTIACLQVYMHTPHPVNYKHEKHNTPTGLLDLCLSTICLHDLENSAICLFGFSFCLQSSFFEVSVCLFILFVYLFPRQAFSV